MTDELGYRTGTAGVTDARIHDLDGLRHILGDNAVRVATGEDSVDGVAPSVVAEPSSIEELAAVMSHLHESRKAMAPRGTGTKMRWGNPPSKLDIIIGTQRLDRVLEHASGDLIARVQAGVTLRELQQVLGERGQWLPLDPLDSAGTIGGIIAANAFGPRRVRSGTARDLLIGFTYVLPDGTVAKAGGKVVKNVAGYDLGKLFCGSLGTLGLIADATFRLYPRPEARGQLRVTLDSDLASSVTDAIQTVLNSSLVASALVFQRHRSSGTSLSMLFEGVHRGVQAQLDAAQELLRAYGSMAISYPLEGEIDASEHFEAPVRPQPGGTILRISSVMSGLSDVILHLENRVPKDVLTAIWGFVAPPVIYADLGGPDEEVVNAIQTLRRLLGGIPAHVVVQDAPMGVKRCVDVWGDVGDALPLMRQVKEMFDPRHIMNPGRFVGGI